LEAVRFNLTTYLVERTPPEMFATMFYGIITQEGQFTYSNAGHATPLVVRTTGKVDRLEESNFPLGLFPKVKFDAHTAQLNPGEYVLVFSDGITEAQDLAKDMFGEERLEELLAGRKFVSAEEISETVVNAIRQFVGTAPQADDVTLFVLRYDAPHA
jgi:sigma-B regulation protein RsbU (phosphoserine phosphatase)